MSWQRWRVLIQRALFLPVRADRDLNDEIRFHLDEEARLQSDRGLTGDHAALAARRLFGNVTQVKETTRAVWVSTALEQLLQDLRFGCRILTRSPGLSATAIALIALVIGGNTTVFSMAHGILAKPSPGVHAAGLRTVSWVLDDGDIETHVSYRVYAHFVEHSTILAPLAAFDFERLTMTDVNASYAVRAGIVSPNYFETLGVRLVKGRTFTAQEREPGPGGTSVVVSHQLWQTALGGIDDVVGHAFTLNGEPATVVGVAEPGFCGALFAEQADLWVPLAGEAPARDRPQPYRRGTHVAMIGRLDPNASATEAAAELSTLWSALQRGHPDLPRKMKLRLVAYSGTAGGNSLVSMYGNRMLAIFSIVTLLTIAIVCANVTNLLIARALVRQREMALRQSLGASRVRILRSLLAEGFVLSVVAWITACVVAWWVSKTVVRFVVPPTQSSFELPDLTPDWTVVAYALSLALLCTVAVTVGPAWRTWRQQLVPDLKVGQQIVQPRSRLSRGLLVLQLACSVLLLTTAGLAHRSMALADAADVGFETANILLATVNTAAGAKGADANGALLEVVKARLERLPGVESVSYVQGLRASRWSTSPVRRDVSAQPVLAVENHVGADYFRTLGVPFVAGRDFARNARGGRTAIVNQHLADALWPGEYAVGKILLTGPIGHEEPVTIAGVVRDAYFGGRGSETRPRYVFFASERSSLPPGEYTFHIRHSGRHDAVAPAVRKAVREANASVPISNLRSLQDQIAEEIAPLWTLAMLLTLFAAGSLLIAAIGQYGVVAFDSRRRSREFGVRIALGASPRHLVGSVIAENLRLTAAGLVLGFLVSVGVGALLARFLYGVTPTDPPTYLGVVAILTASSLTACYLPARRATRIDPMIALRTD